MDTLRECVHDFSRELRCCACLTDKVNLTFMPCFHIVCQACLKMILKTSSICPECRQTLSNRACSNIQRDQLAAIVRSFAALENGLQSLMNTFLSTQIDEDTGRALNEPGDRVHDPTPIFVADYEEPGIKDLVDQARSKDFISRHYELLSVEPTDDGDVPILVETQPQPSLRALRTTSFLYAKRRGIPCYSLECKYACLWLWLVTVA